MSQLFISPFIPAFGVGGLLSPSAKLYFYLTGTTTDAEVYTTSDLTTPHAQPVVANSGGAFASIYLDPGVTYRVVLKTAAGATIADADPLTNDTSALGDVTTITSYGAVGNNATDNTTVLQTMLDGAVAKASFFAPPNADGTQGIYLLDTITTAKAFELGGVGEAMFRGKAGSTVLIAAASDSGFPEDGATRRYVHDLELDSGITPYGSAYRAGCVGLKWGDTSSSVVHNTDERLFVHGFAVGVIDYSTQQATSNNSRVYRNNWGRLTQSDPTHGGATASRFSGNTYQLNYVGRVLDTTARFNMATTGTLSNGSTAVTAVASTAGIANGMKITGPGIKPNTTVASFVANTSITLSQATTATAAMAKVPLRIYNNAGYGSEWQESDALFQGNGWSALAVYGMDSTWERPYFEGNRVVLMDSYSTAANATYSARVPPQNPVYVEGARLTLRAPNFNEYTATTACIRLAAGAELYVYDGFMGTSGDPATGQHIAGDLTCSAAFFGKLEGPNGIYAVPVTRWPDRLVPYTATGAWAAFGVPLFDRSDTAANGYDKANPRIPLLENPAGGATVSYARDALMGPVSAVQYAAVVGSLGGHSIDTSFLGGVVTSGDVVLRSVFMRADTYTNVRIQTQGAGTTVAYIQSIPVAPYWQRYVVQCFVLTSDTNVKSYVFPVEADGPKVYFANEMQYRAVNGLQTGGSQSPSVSELSEIVARGLFNDNGNNDGTLIGTAVYDPPNLIAGATTTTTIALNGVLLGDTVTGVSFSLDGQGILFEGYISATNVITVRLTNPTAGAIDLASGTLRAVVRPN